MDAADPERTATPTANYNLLFTRVTKRGVLAAGATAPNLSRIDSPVLTVVDRGGADTGHHRESADRYAGRRRRAGPQRLLRLATRPEQPLISRPAGSTCRARLDQARLSTLRSGFSRAGRPVRIAVATDPDG